MKWKIRKIYNEKNKRKSQIFNLIDFKNNDIFINYKNNNCMENRECKRKYINLLNL